MQRDFNFFIIQYFFNQINIKINYGCNNMAISPPSFVLQYIFEANNQFKFTLNQVSLVGLIDFQLLAYLILFFSQLHLNYPV